jgi:ATP-dependent protease HslVU (ClpYQ) peptidase subunit
MTVIVGIADGTNVYIGGDRAASDGDSVISMSRPKVGVRGDWIYGYSGDIGIGQYMDVIDLPVLDKDDDPYMVIINELIYAMHERIDRVIKTDEPQADFLIGARGRLFELSTEAWGVIEINESSIGSGSQFALGSLHTTYTYTIPTKERVELALNAAITYSPSCQAPIDILYI